MFVFPSLKYTMLERAIIGGAGNYGILSKSAGVVEGGGPGVGLQD